MGKNKVQFQKTLISHDFKQFSKIEEQRFKELIRMKWFNTFQLFTKYRRIQSRQLITRKNLLHCNACHDAMIFHKLAQIMLKGNKKKLLSRIFNIDIIRWKGRRASKPILFFKNETSFLSPVRISSNGCSLPVKYWVEEIKKWYQQHITEGITVDFNTLIYFSKSWEKDFFHQLIFAGKYRNSEETPRFKGLNNISCYLKTSLPRIRQKFWRQHLFYSIFKFQYQFSRKFSLRNFFPKLGYIYLKAPPSIPLWFLKINESYS